jgi:hypothetical protein
VKGLIPVIQGQKRLNYSCYPEECNQPSDEHEHLPLSYVGTGKMALGKNYAYYQKDHRFHQLKELQA